MRECSTRRRRKKRENTMAENDYAVQVIDTGKPTVILRYYLKGNGADIPARTLDIMHIDRNAWQAFEARLAVPEVPEVPADERLARRLEFMQRDLAGYLASDAGKLHARGIYRDIRKWAGWQSVDAWRFAVRRAATTTAVATGYLAFQWDTDALPVDVDDDGETAAKVESGEYRNEECAAFILPDDNEPPYIAPGEYVSNAIPDASLCGIITDYTDNGRFYRQEIECQLADEAGVLPDLPAPWTRRPDGR